MRLHTDDTASSRNADEQLFVVIGAQRTGTNILREILNTNDNIAMLGEILSPSPAPAHWENFCRSLSAQMAFPVSVSEAEGLLDQYFDFVRYRIRNHWTDKKKKNSHAFGVDIKYNQLSRIAPANWYYKASPFILRYLRSRRATLIHTTRNVIHCTISTLIASQRKIWHNYDGTMIDRSYHIDVQECLSYARTIVQDRESFLESVAGCKIVECCYEHLVEDMQRAGTRGAISEGAGPLRDIAEALGSPFDFRYDGHLQKAINVPYSKLISNFDALVVRLKHSEFAELVSTLN